MIHALNYTDWLYRPRRDEELRDGGGVLFNQAPHQVDVIRLLGGGRVKSVRAQTGAWDEQPPCDWRLLGVADVRERGLRFPHL